MKLGEPEARKRLGAARVARLATAGDDRRPHLVPVTFALDGDRIYIAVDHKPKTTTNLRRLRNIRENPQVALLADHYEEDWSRLWWVRADGRARVLDPARDLDLDLDETEESDALAMRRPAAGDERQPPLDVLASKYEQYRRIRPAGPVILITIERITGWSGQAET